MRKRIQTALGFSLVALAITGATNAPIEPSETEVKSDYARPTTIPFPADNPYSAEKVELGKLLFFDRRLSQSKFISCATCHNPSYGWEDGIPVAIGHDFQHAGRHTPTILNLAWGELFFWDGRAASLEEQAKGPIEASGEMNLPHDVAVERIAASPEYQERFAYVFPQEGVTIDTISKAIATYERTIVSGEAPFDRWINGEEEAISKSAKRGFALFNGKANCSVCHAGWRFTDDGFHDVGMPSEDKGRAEVIPGIPIFDHAFKTPTLRNITERAPFMHDGSIETLEEVVRFYDTGFVERESLDFNIRRLNLTDQDVEDLVAFMETLTSQDDPVELPIIPKRVASKGE